MANGLDVKVRDYGRDIAADDPLMELSRIMGFDKPVAEREFADPQLAIEDSFSMDLERELALEEATGDIPSALDAELSSAIEDELSGTMQFAVDAPSVVPSLEDELTALLGNEPPHQHVPDWSKANNGFAAPSVPVETQDLRYEDDIEVPKLELSAPQMEPSVPAWPEVPVVVAEPVSDAAEPWFEDMEAPAGSALASEVDVARTDSPASLEDIAEFEEREPFQDFGPSEIAAARASVDNVWRQHVTASAHTVAAAEPHDTRSDAEPWLDIDLDNETPVAPTATALSHRSAPEQAASSDWVLNEMNRVAAVSPTVAVYDDPAAIDQNSSAVEDFEFDFDADETSLSSTSEVNGDDTQLASEGPATAHEMWQPATEAVQPAARDFARFLEDRAPMPVVEAAEMAQDAVAQTDDFDIPDFDFSPEPHAFEAPRGALPEYEPEYTGFEPRVEAKSVPPVEEDDFDFDAMLDEQWTADNNAPASGLAAPAAANTASAIRPNVNDLAGSDVDVQPFGGDAPQFPDEGFDSSMPRRRSWIVPALLAGVAILGGGVYYAYSGSSPSAKASGPVLVKADPEPVKIAPANPGGKSVPDQDKAVYDKVDGAQAALPSQGTLVSESEEPVDIASVTPEEPVEVAAVEAIAKSEARVEASATSDTQKATPADTAAATPKKVRTFIVKPDGSMVERPAEAATTAASVKPSGDVAVTKAGPAPVPVVPAVKPLVAAVKPTVAKPAMVEPEATPAVIAKQTPLAKPPAAAKTPAAEKPAATVADKSAEPAQESLAKLAAADPSVKKVASVDAAKPVAAEVEAAKPAPAIKVVKTKKIKAPTADTTAAVTKQDGGAPVLESRPADQPVTIVGKTGGQKKAAPAETQVASAEPAPASSTTGAYSIQIASTPSPEAAKSTYAALSRKFGGVIGGKGVNILKAEVDGKGTVYRIRIPAGSKQAATSLCAEYKSSGGNCFVTK